MRVKYEIRRNYPHMIGEDRLVWERFIKEKPGFFDEVEYDVHVGEGMSMPDNWDDKDMKWAKELTQKRIDVIGFRGNEIILVEIKRRVNLATLGQVLGYKFLYEREENLVGKTKSIVIAAVADVDDRDVLGHYDIKLFIA
ncbi:hypothetical protein LCGC14_2889130 [marine sediment metagenome]|uniref:DUF91 domain-containing protein n=1 Tax=marine sediment metagenome TaxID=412755 RepID=A0A0F9A5R8_9ZZZZ|nr:hypothetical protein [bacterium]